jgi:hypothetical protein
MIYESPTDEYTFQFWFSPTTKCFAEDNFVYDDEPVYSRDSYYNPRFFSGLKTKCYTKFLSKIFTPDIFDKIIMIFPDIFDDAIKTIPKLGIYLTH